MSLGIGSVGDDQPAIYVVEEWIFVETFRAIEKTTAKPQQVVDYGCRKSPTGMIKSKELPAERTNVKKQDLTANPDKPHDPKPHETESLSSVLLKSE